MNATLQRPRIRAVIAIAASALVLAGCAGSSFWRASGVNYPVSVTWNDTRWCVPWRLKRVLKRASQRFGPVTVHSTHRWPLENKLKGGKPKSFHLTCKATDFSIRGYSGDITGWLKAQPEVGGYSRYPAGFYHIDTGPRRTW